MQIYINGKQAVLKKGSSFEYVSENRMFSGSDSYTLNITFPLKDCLENIAIFGNLNRSDVVARRVIFDCELRDINFYKFGSITITGVSETEIKAQFLEGRSEQNFGKTLDKVYINELDLGSPATIETQAISPANAWNPQSNGNKYVALPWVNNASANIQNLAEYKIDDEAQGTGHFEWNSEKCKGLSWQPYLIYITKKICEALPGGGYSYDFSKWEALEEYKYLLLCNTLPYAWGMPEFKYVLPHWTVEEYFQKLELFLGCEFDIDHRNKRISFAFTKDTLAAKNPICLQNVIEEHSTDIKVEDVRCEYEETKNLVYKDCDHDMWKFYSCDWYLDARRNGAIRYGTLSQLLAENKGLAVWDGSNKRGTNRNRILYAADCDAYFICRAMTRELKYVEMPGSTPAPYYVYKCRLQPINLFGGRIVNDDDDAAKSEIEFVPAWIDDTEDKYGRMLFLAFSEFDNGEETTDENKFSQTDSVIFLSAGAQEKKNEFYDRIYIGWYDGSNYFLGNRLPYPNVDDVIIADDWSNHAFAHFSLRLNTDTFKRAQIIYNIEPKMKYTFKFIADTIPDVRSVFLISGKRYICEKITATFTENGMSQLLKGEFYPIKES